MARKERKINIKVIKNKNVYDRILIEFFARKYSEKDIKQKS